METTVTSADALKSTAVNRSKTVLNPLFPLSVFNFHHVENTLSKPARKHITITAQGLTNFIRTVKQLGFEPISLKALYQDPSLYEASADRRYCLLTFDDGLVNNLQYALPVLEQEKCPATIFALPGKFGGTNDWDEGHLPEGERDALMTAEQMQQMAASPYITFGSHGLYHSHLPNLSRAEVRRELHESHQILSELLGADYVPVFAYPWGEYSEMVIQEVADSPYDYAVTVENGTADSTSTPALVPRYTVFYRDAHPLMLKAKLYRHGLINLFGQLKQYA